jgi:hypothetical protein
LKSRGLFKTGEPGSVYIHVDMHKSVAGTVKTLVHEMVGHFGLRAVLPTQYWAAILDAYATYNKDKIAELEKKGASRNAVLMRADGNDALANVTSADELIAYLAEDKYTGNPLQPFEQRFLDKVVATVRKWYRWVVLKVMPKSWRQDLLEKVPFEERDAILLLRDTVRMLRDSRPQRINTTAHGRVALMSAVVRLPQNNTELLVKSVDSQGQVWKSGAAGLFLSALQHAERYNFPFVADYMKFVQRWAARKASLQTLPTELATRWHEYNRGKANNLGRALLEMDMQSTEKERALTDAERKTILKSYGVDDEVGTKLAEEVRQSFLKVLDMVEMGLIRQEMRRHIKSADLVDQYYKLYLEDRKTQGTKSALFEEMAKNPTLAGLDFAKAFNAIHSQINALRNRDYFPHMRFGRHAIWVRATRDVEFDGKKYKGPWTDKNGVKHEGQMIHFETHETYKKMKENFELLQKEFKDQPFTMGTGHVSDEEYTMLGMPPALFDTLEKTMNLSDDQKAKLKEIYWTKSPGQRFLRSMVKRRDIRGFSQDALRVYSTYMMNAAGHVARIEYQQDLDDNVTNIRNYAKDSGSLVAGQSAEYWQKHYKYIMNPENDWAGVRALGFTWFLGFNAKSAFVNLTQIPMVAYPYLADRFGDAKSVAALTQAYQDAFKMARGKALSSEELLADLKRGVEEGFLNESLATTLAGFTESSVLERLAPGSGSQKFLNDTMYYGALMFHHVEQINRYVTFIAARKLALEKRGKNAKELAFQEAKEAVQSAMFEYQKWNRAPYMRGKKSVVFLFWNYMQGLAYLMAGKKGKGTALRVWAMLLLAAGFQGIPFMENILDLIDFGGRNAKEALGSKDPYVDSRLWLREVLMNITDNPDFLLHGWSRNYGLGPAHLLELAGVPVPNVNIGGSLSMGQWLPGIDKATSLERDPDKKLGQTMVDVLGPVAGIGYGFWNAMNSSDPDTWKVWERAMPTALKSASQFARRSERGEESFRGGGAIAEFDPTDPEQRLELVFNMLGFTPSKVSNAYEVMGSKENLRKYWTSRQAMVMENYAMARRSGHPEVIADANESVREFNMQVPDPLLRLTPEKIRRSMKARAVKIKNREAGLPHQKSYLRLYEEIDRIYGEK